jgi:hypothetical protein
MDKTPVIDRNGEELVEHGFRELTNDETALVGGGLLFLLVVAAAAAAAFFGGERSAS